MSTDLRELTEFFKDRIDELYLLEGRIEKQAEALSVVSKKCIAANEESLNRWLCRMDNATEDIKDINQASKKIDEHISFCAKHVKLALGLFFGSLTLSACIWGGTYFWGALKSWGQPSDGLYKSPCVVNTQNRYKKNERYINEFKNLFYKSGASWCQPYDMA